MPPSMLPQRPTHRARVWSRYLLLLFIPLAIAFKAWLDHQNAPRDVAGFSFHRPADWSYLTETGIKPDGDHIRFAPAAVIAALDHGQGAPLFALTKYPPPHTGINPVIGVNVAYATDPIPIPGWYSSTAWPRSRRARAMPWKYSSRSTKPWSPACPRRAPCSPRASRNRARRATA